MVGFRSITGGVVNVDELMDEVAVRQMRFARLNAEQQQEWQDLNEFCRERFMAVGLRHIEEPDVKAAMSRMATMVGG